MSGCSQVNSLRQFLVRANIFSSHSKQRQLTTLFPSVSNVLQQKHGFELTLTNQIFNRNANASLCQGRVRCYSKNKSVSINDCVNTINRSADDKTLSKDKVSSLYVPTHRGSELFSTLLPYMNFDDHFTDLQNLSRQFELRKIDVSHSELLSMKKGWKELKSLKIQIENIQGKIEVEEKKIKEMYIDVVGTDDKKKIKPTKINNILISSKYRDAYLEVKSTIKVLNNEEKLLKVPLVDLEETIVPFLLKIPNIIDENTPIDSNTIISTHFTAPKFDFKPKPFKELVSNKLYEWSDLVELELALQDHFLSHFTNAHYLQHSNPDFGKGVVVEGCGIDIHDHTEVIELSKNAAEDKSASIYAIGGASMPSYFGYFSKRTVSNPEKFLPQRLFATGKVYRPSFKDSKNSLFSSQTTVASACILFEKVESSENMLRTLMNTVSDSYKLLGIHFRIVQRRASDLRQYEKTAFSIEVLNDQNSPNSYFEIGRISVIGDYISKRLLMMYKQDDSESSSNEFLDVIYADVADINELVALIVETSQTTEGKYKWPEVLEKYRLSSF